MCYLRWWWHNFSEAKSVIAVEQVASSKSWFPGWKKQSRFYPTEFRTERLTDAYLKPASSSCHWRCTAKLVRWTATVAKTTNVEASRSVAANERNNNHKPVNFRFTKKDHVRYVRVRWKRFGPPLHFAWPKFRGITSPCVLHMCHRGGCSPCAFVQFTRPQDLFVSRHLLVCIQSPSLRNFRNCSQQCPWVVWSAFQHFLGQEPQLGQHVAVACSLCEIC